MREPRKGLSLGRETLKRLGTGALRAVIGGQTANTCSALCSDGTTGGDGGGGDPSPTADTETVSKGHGPTAY